MVHDGCHPSHCCIRVSVPVSVPGQTIPTILHGAYRSLSGVEGVFARNRSNSSSPSEKPTSFDLLSAPVRAHRLTTSGCFPRRPPSTAARWPQRSIPTVATSWCNRIVSGSFRELARALTEIPKAAQESSMNSAASICRLSNHECQVRSSVVTYSSLPEIRLQLQNCGRGTDETFISSPSYVVDAPNENRPAIEYRVGRLIPHHPNR